MSNYDGRSRSRRNGSGVSNTGVVAIIATVFAVGIGFVVLRRIDNETDVVTSLGNGSASEVGVGGASAGGPTETTPEGDVTATTAVTGPTTPPIPTTFAGATVIVANANGGAGSAGKASAVFESVTDFTMGAPTDATAEEPIATSVVYYDPNQVLVAQPVAENLARMLNGLQVAPLPSVEVVNNLDGAGVVLMLGTDLAELTQNDLVPPLTAAEASGATEATIPDAATPETSAA